MTNHHRLPVPFKHKAITPPLEWARAMAMSQQMKRTNLFTYIMELEQRLERLEAHFAPQGDPFFHVPSAVVTS